MQLASLFLFKKPFNKLEFFFLSLFVGLILFYQKYISFLLPPSCRFYPSCSNYSLQAIREYGIGGFFYILLRIMRCHPLCKGGFDPLPKKKNG